MTESGNPNRFTSEYIIGTKLPTAIHLDEIETLIKWFDFKDHDRGLKEYRSERTQNITFLHIIELSEFNKILSDLVMLYHRSNPHGSKTDFILDTFGETITLLDKFIKIPDWLFIPYAVPPSIKNQIYSCDEIYKKRIVDIIIEPTSDVNSKNITHYKQYYRKVISLINDLDFDRILNDSTNIVNSQTISNEENINADLKSLTHNEIPNVLNIINNFDRIPIIEVYNHFKINLVDKKHLTEEELFNFLKLAFEQKKPPKTRRFKIINAKTKQIIISIFYDYYKNIAGGPHGVQKIYAALLGDYFEGYSTKNVSNNFNR